MTNRISKNTTQRDSNLELFRCVAMLLIVAHHYVFNSGLTSVESPIWNEPWLWRSLFLLVFGSWGKTGINCFMVITGYYMCQSVITGRKYFRLLAEIYFYKIAIAIIFALTGYQPISLKILLQIILPFTEINRNFTGCFIVFYLFIPFLSIIVKNMTARQHIWLIVLCLFIYTIVGSIPWTNVPMHYVSWFMVLFLVSSWLRLHADGYMKSENSIWNGGGLLILLIVDIASIFVVTWMSTRHPIFKKLCIYFMSESSKPLPLLTGIMAFMFFKKLRLPYIPLVNIMGGSTFGVLLIHANSDTMRKWLWRDFLHNVDMYDSSWLVAHAAGSVLAIFILCIVIDRLRLRFIEPPVMALFDRYWPCIIERFNRLEVWFARKCAGFTGE